MRDAATDFGKNIEAVNYSDLPIQQYIEDLEYENNSNVYANTRP